MSIDVIKTEKRPYFRSYFVTGKIGNKKFKPGLWHHTTKEKDGETHNIDIWICSPLQSKAIASYGESDFGRLIKYKNVNGNIGEWCAPMTMLSGSSESMRLELLRLGVLISQKHRPLLADYLMEHVPKRQVIAATSTGWHDHDGNRMFILPQLVIRMIG
jgi:putative DNA primase/helicase